MQWDELAMRGLAPAGVHSAAGGLDVCCAGRKCRAVSGTAQKTVKGSRAVKPVFTWPFHSDEILLYFEVFSHSDAENTRAYHGRGSLSSAIIRRQHQSSL